MAWRSLRANEIDHELVWLSVSAALGGVVVAWLRLELPTPPCIFHLATGLPCPTCGVTRALRHIVHGDLPGALHFNPLAVGAMALFVAFDVYAVVVLAFRLRRFRLESIAPPTARWLRIVILSSIVLNWSWLIYARV